MTPLCLEKEVQSIKSTCRKLRFCRNSNIFRKSTEAA